MRDLRRILRLLMAVAVCGFAAALFAATPTGSNLYLSAERWLERAENRARFQAGLPMPGTPDLDRFDERLKEKGLKAGDPVFIRIFKREFELEMWMVKDGRPVLFATYPMCYWSGRLGPKLKEGDLQSPEGFYTVSSAQLNPNSRWHRSFNLGFPNAYDKSHGRTGSYLMVHGGCASIGCYAVTDPVVDEIWRLVTAALEGGQPRFHVHVFPFRMDEDAMAWHGRGTWSGFWADLKQGYDLFERTGQVPEISVCEGRYLARQAKGREALSAKIREDCSVRLSGG